MVLFDLLGQILISPLFSSTIQFSPDRARVTVVTVRRDTGGSDAGHRFGRSEERLGRRHSRFSLSLTSKGHPDDNPAAA